MLPPSLGHKKLTRFLLGSPKDLKRHNISNPHQNLDPMLYDDLSVFTKTDNFTIVLCSVKCYRLTVLAADYTFIDLKKFLKFYV